MEDLLNLLKPYCKSFDLQYKEDKYKLILDEVKDFMGDTVEDVVIDAMDWIDMSRKDCLQDKYSEDSGEID